LDKLLEIQYLSAVVKEGLAMFEDFYQFKAKYFVPTNGPFNNQLEQTLFDGGVKYINTAKKQLEPIGDGMYKKNYRYLGKQNPLGQIYLTRNCFFEPSSFTNNNWVDSCLNEIDTAFRWKKPAVISTHRVNYIGLIDEKNRSKGLIQLKSLIQRILQKYPDVEFMTSVELGDLIADGKKID
jgi:alpha-amylase/alpha-mannosidase (GH57 family)